VFGADGRGWRKKRGAGYFEAIFWVWGAERVFAVYSAVSFEAGKSGEKG
jgi:hypothetical protein